MKNKQKNEKNCFSEKSKRDRSEISWNKNEKSVELIEARRHRCDEEK